MESGSIRKELLNFLAFRLIHHLHLLLTNSEINFFFKLEVLFQQFNCCFPYTKTYRGYQLLACYGSALDIFRNPKDADTYFQSQPSDKGFNQLHLNALFDLCEKRYVDAVIQPARKMNVPL